MAARLRAAAAVLAPLALVAGSLRAQTGGAPGVIRGVVTDSETAGAVANAHVLLAGTPLSAMTDATGAFTVVAVDPGRYTVRVLALGFAPARLDSVVVAAGDTVTLRVALRTVALQLSSIDVTATGSAERLSTAPVSVVVMSQQDVLRQSAIEVQDAMPFVAGVDMNHGEVDIRGASGVSEGIGSRVLMMLDGHPILTGDGGEIDYEQLPILDVERVEVVKGSQSALYGSSAMGGVVNVITTPIDPRPENAMRLYYGAYDVPPAFRFEGPRTDYWGLDAQHSQAIGAVGVRLAVGREDSNGYEQNGESSRWLLRAKLSNMPGASHPWDAYAIYSTLRSGQFYGWVSDSQPYEVPAVALGDWNRVSHLLAGGRYAAVEGTGALLEIEPSATYTWVRDHMHDSHNWHNALRADLNTRLSFHPGSEHSVIFGLELAGTGVNASYYGAKGISDAAPYGQEEFEITRDLRLTAGVRFDYHHVAGIKAETAFNPKLAFAFTPPGPLAFRASLGHGFRAPSVIEQFVSTAQQGVLVVPNPSLRAERAWSGEVGGTATLGRLWLDASVFQSWYNDLIGPAAVPGQVAQFSFQNVQQATVRGLDASAKVSLWPRLVGLDLTWLYLDTRDATTGLPLPYRSRYNATASLNILGGLAGLDWQYRSRLEQVLEYPLDPRGDISLLDVRFALRVKGVVFQAKVSNLLQAQYVDVMERNQGAPRSLMITAMSGL